MILVHSVFRVYNILILRIFEGVAERIVKLLVNYLVFLYNQ